MFIYCDLLGKIKLFPYYKHTLILATLLYARDVTIIKMAAQVVSTHTAIPYAHPPTVI